MMEHGRKLWNPEEHGALVTQGISMEGQIAITNPDGKQAIINLDGDAVEYSGDLPVAESARSFFDALFEVRNESLRPTRQQLMEIAEASVAMFTPPMRRGGILMSEEARVEHERLEELRGLLHAAGFGWEEYT